MKTLLLLLLILAGQLFVKAQVTVVDFVRIKNNHHKEALYFYENNWKLYRDEAMKRGVIQSYQLLSVPADSVANFHLVLMTIYKDSSQYLASEASFEPIIKALRPNGPALLNELKPADFRENIFYKAATTVFTTNDYNSSEHETSKGLGTTMYSDPELIIAQNGDYFMPGEEFEMSFIAPNETSFKIASLSIAGEKQPWKKGGVLTYRFPVEMPGSHEIPVVVSYRDAKGQLKRKNYRVNYMVSMASASIGLDRMNVFYIGIDNPISVATSMGGDDKIVISIQGGGGMLTKVGAGKFVVRVTKPTDDCTISLTVDNKQVGKFQYRVRALPVPTGYVAGHTSGDTVSASFFVGQAGVSAGLRDFPFELRYSIVGFNLSIQDETGTTKAINCQGAEFSPEAKQLMKEYLKPGTTVTIGNLFAKAPDGREMKLLPLVYFIK